MQLDNTRRTMEKNVELITKNISTAEELEDQTREMTINAQKFQKQSVVLKKKYWWKNAKLWVMIVICLIVVLCLVGGVVALLVYYLK
ncbi:hypothetical protein EIN_155740 [Entamoeba invadens IP1]|uniref:V-SNARE coiled-coil homology domain-containing protein n=1 Tax=Entamoeba invadens IP1 TaxID=370355 RepID=A0A0A1U9D7_ENTIV|nr:hypothetical protein EIN_155740 [Entamoeba invadens IP1]ELP91457.1 hypothetical protein EIN_155740 [Entamoeba invadens IP1]|eukprot:XP_004258228.1 hypothetical protein EIN_155740 [Entamoeba invadens IP1]